MEPVRLERSRSNRIGTQNNQTPLWHGTTVEVTVVQTKRLRAPSTGCGDRKQVKVNDDDGEVQSRERYRLRNDRRRGRSRRRRRRHLR